MKSLFKYLGRYKAGIILVVLLALGGASFNVIGPKISGKAVTLLFDGLISKYSEGGAIDFEKIMTILIGLLALYGVAALFGIVSGVVMSGVTQKTGYELRTSISEKIDRMPMKYFESRSVGDVLSCVTNDVDMLTQSLSQIMSSTVSAIASIVGSVVMMLSISPLMTLIALALLPVSAAIIAAITKFSQKYFYTQQEYLGKINGQVEETIAGQGVVRLFNHEGDSRETFAETNKVLYSSAWKSQFFTGLMFPIINFIGNLGYVGVAIYGGILAFKGTITVGDIQAFIQYVRNFTQPIGMISQSIGQLQMMAAAAERVFEFLGEEEETPDAEDSVDIGISGGNVKFEHVRFGYTEDKVVIGDLSIDVTSGDTVAIVGPTGAGKTTLVKLLMRFYDVDAGAITVDGHDIRAIRRASLRKNFGMVLQDTWLFKGTIRDNIKYGKPDATDEEVKEAAKTANAHRFIKTLPGGYDYVLSEEADDVSVGQKQLLTIARAVLADSPILILDEATSSVDTRSEKLIQKAMNNLKKGRTSFVIAHRLST
ncbi:MAG: ABC transporter ATP-binding protein/permease, partial [Clostridiales Family XIII bacterium]|nr:ABC transporter ATP-binding protein/permease [Clostridiales Family XIII bacterium]